VVEPLFIWDGPEPQVAQTITLTGPEAKHAASVRRMRVGEAIQVTDGKGLRVRGQVATVAADAVQILVEETSHEARPAIELTLIQALAKGDRDELAVQAATELGVMQVVPWQAERSVSRWDGPKVAKGLQRWQAIVDEAAKQALRVWTPAVLQPVTTKELAKQVAQFEVVLVLDPTAEVGLASVKLPAQASVALVVGPEGGISPAELTALQQAGATRVHLGASILRTSTAGMAAVAALQAGAGNWG
jgi:16S rRNA (uracil1498-N3)-methyltransferase